MSDSISNIRNIPSTHPIKPVVLPDKDRKPGKQEIDREKPEECEDDSHLSDQSENQDKPLLDEYV
jgi:hypothetical protein